MLDARGERLLMRCSVSPLQESWQKGKAGAARGIHVSGHSMALLMHSRKEWYVYIDVTRSVAALPAASVQVRRHLYGNMVVTNQQLPVKSPEAKQEH